MKSLFMVPVVLVLLSCVPPGKMKCSPFFRKSCGKKEEYSIFCSSVYLCCTDKKNLPWNQNELLN
uniref:Beta-defensin n=1 Tax=Neovison vison TaxID=452646 RepID=A0A8C7EWD4_NEOVI